MGIRIRSISRSIVVDRFFKADLARKYQIIFYNWWARIFSSDKRRFFSWKEKQHFEHEVELNKALRLHRQFHHLP